MSQHRCYRTRPRGLGAVALCNQVISKQRDPQQLVPPALVTYDAGIMASAGLEAVMQSQQYGAAGNESFIKPK